MLLDPTAQQSRVRSPMPHLLPESYPAKLGRCQTGERPEYTQRDLSVLACHSRVPKAALSATEENPMPKEHKQPDFAAMSAPTADHERLTPFVGTFRAEVKI